MAKATTTKAVPSNACSSLLFLNKTHDGSLSVSGYHRDADLKEYRVANGTVTKTEGGAPRVEYIIYDSETQDRVGHGFFVKRMREQKNPKAPIADGRITFNNESYGVCVSKTNYADGSTGFNVWPNKNNTANVEDAGF